MTVRRLVALALQSILRNPARSLLTILGVVIGVASVVMVVAVGLGAQAEVQARITNLGSNLVVITPGSSPQGGAQGGAGSFNRITVDDALFLDREAQLLTEVSPVVFTRTQVVAGQLNWRATVYGVGEGYQRIRDWELASGRFFTKEEQSSGRKVAVLGATVARTLFEDTDPVGATLRLGKVPFEVIGVLEPKGQTAEGNDQDDVVLAPYPTVQARLAGRMFIAQLLGSAASEGDIPDAMEEARALLRESHKLAAWEDDDFIVRDQSQIAAAAQETTKVMTLLLSSIAGISLVVGGIGIMNIMLVSVTERTREIGIRRAIGARRQDVLAQFLVESVVLSGLGGVLGAAFGSAASVVLGRLTGWSTVISPTTLLVAFGFSAAVGIFFGWYPARRAAGLDPIEALRHQ